MCDCLRKIAYQGSHGELDTSWSVVIEYTCLCICLFLYVGVLAHGMNDRMFRKRSQALLDGSVSKVASIILSSRAQFCRLSQHKILMWTNCFVFVTAWCGFLLK